jgi:predicted ATPase
LGTQRRAAIPRHRTMQAVVDWSYGLLSEDEQRFLRALGIFAGGFNVEAAAVVAVGAATAGADAIDRLADLVAKSLVVADVSGTKPRFRLLDTTRAYAIDTLAESGERERIARHHAEYYRNLFEHAENEAATRPTGDWLADYAREIDNLRAALEWAFSPGGDGSIGVVLTAAAFPLWTRLSLLEECRSRAKQALGALGTGTVRDSRQEMRLHTALGASTPDVPEMGAAYMRALDIAESLGDSEYQLRTLHGLYAYHAVRNARYHTALRFAQKFHDLAASGSDSSAQLMGERIMATAKHFLGDQISARRHLEHVLTHYPATDRGRDVIRYFGTDSRVVALVFLARVLWLQGLPDQAVRTAEMCIGEARATGHALSLCWALGLAACPIALWVGNLAAAAHHTGMLLDHSRKHSLPLWSGFGARFQRVVVVLKGGGFVTESQMPDTGPDEIAMPNVSIQFLPGLSELAEALAHAGRIAEGLALVDAGIRQSETGWLTPELLRLKGEIALLRRSPAVAEPAEDLFRQALDEARQQGALSWELRAATSLARLLCHQGRSADAIACLQPVYDRFTEGFETADLIAAKRLLDEPGCAGRS